MKEIAAELGLSRKTVSAVLNSNGQPQIVRDETARRVREHLELRGYVPSRQARQLRVAPTRVLGLLYLEGLYSHLIDAFHLLAKELGKAAPEMEIVATSPERLEASVRSLLARRVTDLVWIHNGARTELFRDPRLAGYLARLRPVIYNFPFGTSLGEEELLKRGFRLVGIDRTAHLHRLARFLRRLGHRMIALPDVALPHSGYDDLFRQAGLSIADCPPPFNADKFLNVMRRQKVTAACFHGDAPACQAITDLKKRGVHVPEDLTVIGFDGTARSFGQNLTTLEIPVSEMVARVGEIVAGTESGLRHCFGLKFIKGETHGSPRGTVFTIHNGADERPNKQREKT